MSQRDRDQKRIRNAIGQIRGFLIEGYRDRVMKLSKHKSRNDICTTLNMSTAVFDRLHGDLARNVLRQEYGSHVSLLNESIEGVSNPDGPGKRRTRDMMLEFAQSMLHGDVHYLGLENVNFRSYLLLAQNLPLKPDRSTIVESEEYRFRIMQSIKANADLWKSYAPYLRDIELRWGAIDQVIPAIKGKFNIVNLDYEGQYSVDKSRVLGHLATRLQQPALLCVTFNNSPRSRTWFLKTYRTDPKENRMEQLDRYENVLHQVGLRITPLARESYDDSVPMLFGAFRIDRSSSVQHVDHEAMPGECRRVPMDEH